jgi:8-oxo-dGTP diphosphatase
MFKSHFQCFTCSDESIERMLLESVDVVVGIIWNGNKFLVERRRLDEKVDPGIVCLPGGHVKANESKEEALKRELREELGIEAKRFQFICKNFYVASNGERQNAYCYLVTEYEGKPVCKSAQEVFWEDKIENLSLDVDRKTITKLREFIDVYE